VIEEQTEFGARLAGQSVWYKGSSTKFLVGLLVFVAAGAFSYAAVQHDAHSSQAAAATVAAVAAVKDTAEVNQAKLERKFDAMIYVLTLSEKERKNLNLAKPKELRDLER
jgi:hypothetical protein